MGESVSTSMMQAWRVTLKRGNQTRRFIVEEMVEVGDRVRIKREGEDLWTVTKKEPTQVILRIPLFEEHDA